MKKRLLSLLTALLLFSFCLIPAVGAGGYTDDELCEMARQFCKARGDYTPEYFMVDHENGNEVVIHLFDVTGGHWATSDWYTVDRRTGKGTDFSGKSIDLSPYGSGKPAGNSEFTIQNGVLVKYNGPGGNVVIPSGVTEIGEEAFWACTLTSVSIPDGVKKISESAFAHCEFSNGITIPDSVTVIERDAFLGCAVDSVVIGGGVTRIGDAVFEMSSVKNVTIREGVKEIGDFAFRNCENLTDISIPGSVTQIGEGVFDMIDGSVICGTIPGLTIHGAAGSYAETYAGRNEILFQSSGAAPRFTDVPANAYYAAAVDWAVRNQITSGTSSTTFSPNKICTITEILTFLWRADGSPSTQSIILWASQKDMVSYTENLSAPCTRGDAVTYLWKLAGRPSVGRDTRFSDVPARADYAQAVAWAVQQGIASGTGKNTFSPGQTCTRAQIVTLLYQFFG